MIRVEMHGRLGNQLFQYATARALQIKTGQDITISFRTVLGESDKEGNSGWTDSLQNLNTVQYTTYNKKIPISIYKSSVIQIFLILLYYLRYKPFLKRHPYDFSGLYGIQSKWAGVLSKYGIWWLKQGECNFSANYKGNYLLNGAFESEIYFDNIREILLKEYTPKNGLTGKQSELATKLSNCNSVSISVRHFELANSNRDELYNVCTPDYYYRALEIIKSKIDNPVFYISSNDMNWVRNNLDFSDNNVIYEDPDDDPIIKLSIIKHCKSFIISNSTFSWWTQYLSTSKDKIVIAPKKWYNNDFKSPLLSDRSWILL